MEKEQQNKPPRMRTSLRVLLFGSLALNLLIVGVVVGSVAKHRGGERWAPRLDQVTGPYTHALSWEDKRAIGKAMRESYREHGQDRRKALKAEYGAMVKALRATPYDPVEIQAILERQSKIAGERLALGQRLLIDRLQQMTGDERAEFADRLAEALEHRRHGFKGRDGKRKWHD